MNNQPEDQKKYSSLTGHLIELRSRLIKVILVLIFLVIILTPFLQEIITYITHPMLASLPEGNKMSITGVLEGIIVPLKVLLATAFIISLPFTLYQAWAFIAPGLYSKEKKVALPILLSSLLLFFLGMAFCYFIFFPALFTVAATFTPKDVAYYIPTINNYISFILTMFIVFGLAFQVPIVMFVLNKMGAISIQQFKSFRGYAIIAAFAIAAITTPPDIISQFFLAIPLVVLYELGLIACHLNKNNNN
ncbi:MAG: twin-arginine translocase subunit TatC [Neisseriaceae bacterium]|nr:twin-arginine translocase subunit TatC [Neisseriaceae bacterium PsAf]MCV2503467.1 twin-arginine translocase subunit TatC [Neisseriaceae bacterium]MCV2508868.1 twin-arginine translocase subunit TatC [Neisseriaceae bacterium]